LSKLPPTSKENEDILPIVYSMLNFSRDEITQITDARAELAAKEKVATQTKKGLFGFSKGKK